MTDLQLRAQEIKLVIGTYTEVTAFIDELVARTAVKLLLRVITDPLVKAEGLSATIRSIVGDQDVLQSLHQVRERRRPATKE